MNRIVTGFPLVFFTSMANSGREMNKKSSHRENGNPIDSVDQKRAAILQGADAHSLQVADAESLRVANAESLRVADAPADIWVYQLLPPKFWPYAQLARWDRPIGWWLLLWPCWWSLALAIGVVFQKPENWALAPALFPALAALFVVFWLGAVIMRGAGCTYNDLVDVNIDSKVERTASRPIPSGRVSRKQVLWFLVLQMALGFVCLVALSVISRFPFNLFAFLLGLASLAVVVLYPFAKRVTNWPQFVLGLAFSWGALMGWGMLFGKLSLAPILLYAGSILWVIGYDTIYAHQDREDDAIVGVRSTARLFGEKTKPALIILYTGTLVLFALAFREANAGAAAYAALAIGCGHMVWQIMSLDIDDADKCLSLFRSNSTLGWIIFGGLLVDIVV